MRLEFNEFNSKNLLGDIKSVVVFEETEEKLITAMDKCILSRLSVFGSQYEILYYVFEKEYVETEWKDMISIHYINTSYKTAGTVMRVHLFSEKKNCEENYLGFFTLRNINDIDFMLSYIYPNWKNLRIGNGSECFYMTYKKRIHILGNEMLIHTYPLFVQDSAVTSCSQASMISMSNYLKNKYGLEKIRILDINSSYTYGKKKVFPTLGLDPVQMLEIFDYNGIPIDYKVCDEQNDRIKEHIDFCIESAMPVLLGIHITGRDEDKNSSTVGHVLQIIGHTIEQDGDKKYIIYDDSGYYVAERNGVEHGTASFVEIVSWDEIEQLLKKTKDDEAGFIIYPIQEKIYILYEVLSKWHIKDIEKSIRQQYKDLKKRIFVVDNVILKKYLKGLIIEENSEDEKTEYDELYDNETEEVIRDILEKNQPHYLWAIEYTRDNGNRYLFVADPTLNATTKKSILLLKKPIPMECSISLLNEFESIEYKR